MTTDDQSALLAAMQRAQRILVFTGAGVSTGSGLPDFRSPTGLWTRYDPREMTFDRHVQDVGVRRAGWEMRRELLAAEARPNPAHEAIARLEAMGRGIGVVTQNVDGLHQAAGSRTVVELHGTSHETMCIGTAPIGGVPDGCGWRDTTRAVLARIDAGEEDPRCPDCGGLLKAATISFGQAMDPVAVGAAYELVDRCDLLVVVGSSLQVYPAAAMVPDVHRAGNDLAIVNAEPTAFDPLARAVVREPAEAVLPAVVARLEDPRSLDPSR